MVQRLISVFDEQNNLNLDDHFVLAVSGGRDSMLLFHLFLQANINFSIVHCNYNLRPEAIQESALVKSQASQYQIPLYCRFFDLSSQKNKGNIQSVCRDLRYSFFDHIVETTKAKALVTAHHLDDQIETFFLQAFRGSSTRGLKSMQIFNGRVFRPLLSFTRKEIDDQLREKNIPFLDDTSNSTSDYRRNALRNNILQPLHGLDPNNDFRMGLHRTIQLQATTDEFIESVMEQVKNDRFTIKDKVGIVQDYKNIHPFILGRWLSEETFFQWQINKITSDENIESAIFIGKVKKLQVCGSNLCFTMLEAATVPSTVLNTISNLEQIFHVEEIDMKIEEYEQGNHCAYFDINALHFPLTYRLWQNGDRINPLGMGGKSKKIQDVLTDHKVSSILKNNVMLLEDAKAKILWLPKYVRSNIALIDDKTTMGIKLELIS